MINCAGKPYAAYACTFWSDIRSEKKSGIPSSFETPFLKWTSNLEILFFVVNWVFAIKNKKKTTFLPTTPPSARKVPPREQKRLPKIKQ